jgi:hypothetical protein
MSDTSAPSPQQRLRRVAAAKYLNDVHGIPYTEKTLRNRNAAGLGPLPEYLGTIPFYAPRRLDDFAATAFTQESPVTATRRRHAEAASREIEPPRRPPRKRGRPRKPPVTTTAPAAE